MSALWLFFLGTILVTGGFIAITEFGGAGAPMDGAPSFSAILEEVTEIAEKIDEQVSGRTSEVVGEIDNLLGDLPERLGVENDDDATQADAPSPDEVIAEPSSTGASNPESDDNPQGPADFGSELGTPPDVAAGEDPGEQAEENQDDGSRQKDPDNGGNGRRVDVCQSGSTNTVTVDQHGGAALVNQGGEEGACGS